MLDMSMVEPVREALLVALRISMPILSVGVVVGLAVSIVQTITSIQEQTLSFVPKIFAMILVILVLLGWIIGRLADFSVEMFQVHRLLLG